MEFLASITGILGKVYDDYADNKEAYSFLDSYSIPLQILVVACSIAFASTDTIFLIYIFVIIISDCILYSFKVDDESFKLNLALDMDAWKAIAAFGYCFLPFRIHSIVTTFTGYEYGLLSFAASMVALEIYSQVTKSGATETKEDTHLFLEASNQKLITRILELLLCGLLFYFIVGSYEWATKFRFIVMFAASYFTTSIVSILYLKYHYFHSQGKPMFSA